MKIEITSNGDAMITTKDQIITNVKKVIAKQNDLQVIWEQESDSQTMLTEFNTDTFSTFVIYEDKENKKEGDKIK